MARIALIEQRDDVPAERQAEFDVCAGTAGRVGGPNSVVLYTPELAAKMAIFSRGLRDATTVSEADRELASIVVARETKCRFAWTTHAGIAVRAGVPQSTVDAVAQQKGLDAFSDAERGIVEHARRLVNEHNTSDEVVAALVAEHGERWFVELSLTISLFLMLTGMMNAVEVDPPEGSAPTPF